MKPLIQYRFNVGLRNLIFVFGILIFGSCGAPSTSDAPDEYIEPAPSEGIPDDGEEPNAGVGALPDETAEDTSFTAPPSSGVGLDSISHSALEDYSVILDVQGVIKTQSTGEFKVWIGAQEFVPKRRSEVVRDSSSIPLNIAHYAKITPYAPDFTVDPVESKCIRIHPTGTTARFTLTPKKRGTFNVSAIVELYDNESCSGVAIPKSAETLSVTVEVDRKALMEDKSDELLGVVWDKFLVFWAAVIALIFAVLFFVIKRFLKKKTGYEDDVKP